MPKEKEMTIEEKIYAMLMDQTFMEWYDNDFNDHIEGDAEAKSKKELLEDIKKLLGP